MTEDEAAKKAAAIMKGFSPRFVEIEVRIAKALLAAAAKARAEALEGK